MVHLNESEIYLRRAREFDSLAATSADPFIRDTYLQIAEGYWTMLGNSSLPNKEMQSAKNLPNSQNEKGTF